jgi:putative membrane protein
MKTGILLMLLGLAALAGIIGWYGAAEIGRDVFQALWVLPPVMALHALQLHLSAIAWRGVSGAREPGIWPFLLVRWIRESVNSVLPVAQLGGNLVGIRLLMQRGMSGAQAGAGTTIDLTLEVITQAIFTLIGIAVLAAISAQEGWAPWLLGTAAAMLGGAGAFILAQRLGLMRLVEKLARALERVFPAMPADILGGLHDELIRLQRHRAALLRGLWLHLAAWMLGVAETWLALAAMGHPTALAEAMVMESIGMAARSAGFAVPGALGVQEAGFIVAGQLCGLPPEAAIALSVIKRARELGSGVPGVLAWQWLEGRRVLARRANTKS